MKISRETLGYLKNFAGINANLLVRPGNKLSTVSEAKHIVAEVKVKEEFPVQFGIFDLNSFLGAVSLLDDPDFDFGEKSVTISKGKSKVKYWYANEEILTSWNKSLKLPDSVITFDLSEEVTNEANKFGSVLGVQNLIITSVEGKLVAVVSDKKNPTSNTYQFELGECAETTPFSFIFKVENLKMKPGPYKVSLSTKSIAEFRSARKGEELVYGIAMETDSRWGV